MADRENNSNNNSINFENMQTNELYRNKDEEEGISSASRRQTNKFLSENIIGKLTMMSLAALVLLSFRQYGIPDNDVHCIVDEVHDFLNPLNYFLNSQLVYTHILIASSSFFMDCAALSIFVYWLFYIRNLRFMLTITIFYVIRAIHMFIIHIRFPFGYYWNDPHFLTLSVPYGRQSDFFFSGHCGFLAICFFEWRSLGWRRLQYAVFIGGIYLAFVLLVLKVHYIIDITAGVMLAHYFHLLSQHYHEKIEKQFYKMQIFLSGILGFTTLKENLKKEALIYYRNYSSTASDDHSSNYNQQLKESNHELSPSERFSQK